MNISTKKMSENEICRDEISKNFSNQIFLSIVFYEKLKKDRGKK